MTAAPLISVCIPAYNQRPHFLRACIASALAQTYAPLEVIVSDNHSTDDTAKVLAEFDDGRLKVVRPSQHVDMSGNFAFAAAQSTGEYLTLLSSDDMLLPDCCARLAPILQYNPQVAFAFGAIHQIDEQGRRLATQRKSHPSYIRRGDLELQRFVRSGGTWIIGGLIRRSAYDLAGGFGTGFDEVSDWYLALRLLTVGDIAYVAEPLANVRLWTDAARERRLVRAVNHVRRLYDWLASPEMLPRINGGLPVINLARRQWAIDVATQLPSHRLSPAEKAATVREIQLLHNGFNVRARLWLGDTPLAAVMLGWSRSLAFLRSLAVKVLYRLRAGKRPI